MKKLNKTMLTIGTVATIMAPVAYVVACTTEVSKETLDIIPETPEVKRLKAEIGDAYRKLEPMIQTMTLDNDYSAQISQLRAKIAELTHKLEALGYKANRNVLSFDEINVDLTTTDLGKAQTQLIELSNVLSRLSAAIQDATTLSEMKSYYPQYINVKEQKDKILALINKLNNPIKLEGTSAAKKYDVSQSSIEAFTNSIKLFFNGSSEITSFAEFNSNKGNQIAKIGQVFGTQKADETHNFKLNAYSMKEGNPRLPEADRVGFGMQRFGDLKNGLVPHIDIKYEISNGIDDASINSFFSNLENSMDISFLGKVLHAETLNASFGLKLFPYVYTEEQNPEYIHFALFAYSPFDVENSLNHNSSIEHYSSTLEDYDKFKSSYDSNESVKRGVDLLSEVVGRDLSQKDNYYTTNDDYLKVMNALYYAPKRDEMEYINSHISDADRIPLYWQTIEGGGAFNTFASGRVNGVSLDQIYSGENGEYAPTFTPRSDLIDQIKGLNYGETPGYQTQTKDDAQKAMDNFRDVMKVYFKGDHLDEESPGRRLPSLAQSRFGWRDAVTYDIGSIIPFDRDDKGTITGISDLNYENKGLLVKGKNPVSTTTDGLDLQEIADLHEAMYAMSNNYLGWEDEWRMGLDVWDKHFSNPAHDVKGRFNPFISELDLSYITVRNDKNKNDLDLIVKASRNGKDLPTYKITIPEGAMNSDQVDEAVKEDPIYAKPLDAKITKEDFEFMMMKVMSKWIGGGEIVSNYVLPSVGKLVSEGLKTILSIEEIDKYYNLLKNDNSIDLWRLNELVTNPGLDFMNVFMSEGADQTDRKTLYTKYGENLLNVIAKVSKYRILENPSGVDQDVIDSLTNEFAGL